MTAGGRRGRTIGVVASVALVLVAVLLAVQDQKGRADPESVDTSPHFVDADDLMALEDSLGHEVYWAGELGSDRLELSQKAEGSVYLRYLPPGTDAGDPRPRFLTVGTYPVVGAVAALRRTAVAAGSRLGHVDGGVVLASPSSRGSAYLAYPGSDLQIEVYDPAAGRALELIRSGAIRPVG